MRERAAVNASSPRDRIPLRTLPPTRTAMFPISAWVRVLIVSGCTGERVRGCVEVGITAEYSARGRVEVKTKRRRESAKTGCGCARGRSSDSIALDSNTVVSLLLLWAIRGRAKAESQPFTWTYLARTGGRT